MTASVATVQAITDGSNCGYRGPGGTYWTANPRKSSDDDLARELAAHHPGDRLVLNGQVYIVPTDA